MQYDVLISYSAQEREMVERLAAYLEHYNVTCFVAHRDIPADVAWANGIAAAIEMSRMAVVVYSDSYNSAPWMNRELASVGASGIPVVTMCLTSAPYSEDKAEYLRGTTCVAAIGNAEDAFPMVYEQVCNMFGMPIEAAEQQAVVKKNEVKKQEPKNEEVKEENVVSQPVQKKSHHLLEAFIVGIVLAGAVVALMELLLK